MDEQVLTIAMVMIVASNLGMLWLFYTTQRTASATQELIQHFYLLVRKFMRDTDYDFRALKTRERNQEKAHQEVMKKERRAKA